MQEVLDRANTLWKEEPDRMTTFERTSKQITKKDKKAVHFEHKGVKRMKAAVCQENFANIIVSVANCER